MEQKIVVHLRAGGVHKGVTHDFSPTRDAFHVLPGEGGGVPIKIRVSEMKAMFWVKDYVGNRDFVARRDFDPAKKAPGKRAILTFHDGETVWGTVTEDDPKSPGFFFVPADEADNNVKIFVIRTSLKDLRWAP